MHDDKQGQQHFQDHEENDEIMAAFARQIAAPMRIPERLGPSFEARVMAEVYGIQQESSSAGKLDASSPSTYGWWRRPRTFQLSPLAGVGVAAGIAMLVLASVMTTRTLLLSGPTASRPMTATDSASLITTDVAQRAAVPDTVHIVRFVLMAPDAQYVSVAGDFNAWDKTAMPLTRGAQAGVWTASVELPPGRYEYTFIVEGDDGTERWVLDPSAAVTYDEFRTESSVLTVGATGIVRPDQDVGRTL